MAEEALAGGEEADAAGCPLEEAGAELVLEAADLPAEGRLRDVEAASGAGDVLLLGDGDEVAELGEAHSGQGRPGAEPRASARSKRYRREIEAVLDRWEGLV